MSGPAFKDHFSSTASRYAAYRPSYSRELVDVLADRSPATKTAWDCGCGSGQLSVVLAQRFERVEATDASAEQVKNATPDPRVHYGVARAEASGLEPGSMDLCVAAQAAHWFDLDRYYAEVRRVAKPGALVALVSYGLMFVDAAVDEVVSAFYWGPLHRHWPPERKAVEDGYATLPFPFEKVDAPPIELVVEHTLGSFLGYIGTWSALRSMEQQEGPGPFEIFQQNVARAWGDPESAKPVHWPVALKLGRVS